MSELHRLLLTCLIAGVLTLLDFAFRRLFPRQAAWLTANVGPRQQRLGKRLAIGGFLFLIGTVGVLILFGSSHWPGWAIYTVIWIGGGAIACGFTLFAVVELYHGRPPVKRD